MSDINSGRNPSTRPLDDPALARKAPSRLSLRLQLEDAFAEDDEFMAFARQYFRSAYRKFGSGQSRTDKTTLLLASESERKVRLALQIAKCSRKPGGPRGVPMPQNGKVSAVIVLNVKFHWYVLSLIIFLAMERVLQAISITSETTLITIKYIAPGSTKIVIEGDWYGIYRLVSRYRRGLVKWLLAYPVKDIYFFNERPFWRLPLSICLTLRLLVWFIIGFCLGAAVPARTSPPAGHMPQSMYYDMRQDFARLAPTQEPAAASLPALLVEQTPKRVPTGPGVPLLGDAGAADPLVAPPPSAVSERIDGSTSPPDAPLPSELPPPEPRLLSDGGPAVDLTSSRSEMASPDAPGDGAVPLALPTTTEAAEPPASPADAASLVTKVASRPVSLTGSERETPDQGLPDATPGSLAGSERGTSDQGLPDAQAVPVITPTVVKPAVAPENRESATDPEEIVETDAPPSAVPYPGPFCYLPKDRSAQSAELIRIDMYPMFAKCREVRLKKGKTAEKCSVRRWRSKSEAVTGLISKITGPKYLINGNITARPKFVINGTQTANATSAAERLCMKFGAHFTDRIELRATLLSSGYGNIKLANNRNICRLADGPNNLERNLFVPILQKENRDYNVIYVRYNGSPLGEEALRCRYDEKKLH